MLEYQCGSSDMLQSVDGQLHREGQYQQARTTEPISPAGLSSGQHRSVASDRPPSSSARSTRARNRSRPAAASPRDSNRRQSPPAKYCRPRRRWASPRDRFSGGKCQRHEQDCHQRNRGQHGHQHRQQDFAPSFHRSGRESSSRPRLPATARAKTETRADSRPQIGAALAALRPDTPRRPPTRSPVRRAAGEQPRKHCRVHDCR